jgi:hypothetical protein
MNNKKCPNPATTSKFPHSPRFPYRGFARSHPTQSPRNPLPPLTPPKHLPRSQIGARNWNKRRQSGGNEAGKKDRGTNRRTCLIWTRESGIGIGPRPRRLASRLSSRVLLFSACLWRSCGEEERRNNWAFFYWGKIKTGCRRVHVPYLARVWRSTELAAAEGGKVGVGSGAGGSGDGERVGLRRGRRCRQERNGRSLVTGEVVIERDENRGWLVLNVDGVIPWWARTEIQCHWVTDMWVHTTVTQWHREWHRVMSLNLSPMGTASAGRSHRHRTGVWPLDLKVYWVNVVSVLRKCCERGCLQHQESFFSTPPCCVYVVTILRSCCDPCCVQHATSGISSPFSSTHACLQTSKRNICNIEK